MGVLGWTYDQTLDTPMPAIAAALGARNRRDDLLLTTIGKFLGCIEDKPIVSKEKLTPKIFRQLFGGGK